MKLKAFVKAFVKAGVIPGVVAVLFSAVGLPAPAGAVHLAWDAPKDTDLAQYVVQVKWVASRKWTPWMELARVPAPDTKLTYSTIRKRQYRFRVAAVDTSGNQSTWSAELRYTGK